MNDNNKMIKNENIICIAPNPWFDLWRRRHQLMSRFAKYNRVLYIEPPRSIFSPFVDKKTRGWPLSFRFGLHREKDNLNIYSPLNLFPFNRIKFLNKLNDIYIMWKIRRIIRRLKIDNAILWVYYSPKTLLLMKAISQEIHPKLICHDCYDKFTGYGGGCGRKRDEIEKTEKEIVERSDLVFAVSFPLKRYLQNFKEVVYLIPNAVSEYFLEEKHYHDNLHEDSELDNISKPIIGYIGFIGYKVDFDILIQIAQSRPGWSLVLIGPVDRVNVNSEKIKALNNMSNVYFVPQVPPKMIPLYLKQIDVCLMPFKSYEQINYCSCSPNKLFEYLGLGKSIVSVPLEGIQDFAEVIEIAYKKDEFVPCIERALKRDNENLIGKRIEIARNNTWDQRVEEISDLIKGQIHQKCYS